MDTSPSAFKDTLTKHRRSSFLSRMEDMLERFSPSERLALYIATVALGLSSLGLLAGLNAAVSTVVPADGGTLSEGILGPARFINPVIAVSSADEDLSALVYSGLTKTMPDGTIVPDLASDYSISEDGTVYTFRIRPDAEFHDGAPVTAADVLYTVQLAQNPAIKSTHRADWEGITLSSPDSKTVIFKLPRAYAPFLQNTSFGILPEHLWQDTKPEDFQFHALNTHPVGSGPYEIESVETDSTGAAVRFELGAFRGYALGKPHVSRIILRLYPNEEARVRALAQGETEALAGIPSTDIDAASGNAQLLRVPLPRVFGVFFNQGHAPALTDASARKALNAAIEKDRLIAMVLGGYGAVLRGPIPPGLIEGMSDVSTTTSGTVSTAYTEESLSAAREILTNGGWKFDESAGVWMKGSQQLAFSLATGDTPELTATANAVATAWRQLGAKVTMQVYPISELNINILRPREYDAVLFGEVIGRELDLFAFWHSSQRNDPGLNLALYTNAQADTLLSQARALTDTTERDKLYREFAQLIQEEQPAVFLYAPEFLYVIPAGLHGVELGALTMPAERFLNVHEWYMDEERVWNAFVQ